MIALTRLSGSAFALNSDLIERVDSTPDTVITLVDGSKYVVAEDLRQVVLAIRAHRAEVIALSALVQVGDVEPWADDYPVDSTIPATEAPHLATVTPHPSLQVPRTEGGA